MTDKARSEKGREEVEGVDTEEKVEGVEKVVEKVGSAGTPQKETAQIETTPNESAENEEAQNDDEPEDDDDDDDDDDDEPDEWDQRINKTGCAEENLALQLCHYDKQDWRQCIDEMDAFRKCWAAHNNNERTQAKDNDVSDF